MARPKTAIIGVGNMGSADIGIGKYHNIEVSPLRQTLRQRALRLYRKNRCHALKCAHLCETLTKTYCYFKNKKESSQNCNE